MVAGGSTSKSGGSTNRTIHAIMVYQSYTHDTIFPKVIMPSTPTPPTFTLQLFLDSLFFGPYFFQRRNEPKAMNILSGKSIESRNSCSVKVGGVGVEEIMSLRKIGTLV